MRTIRHALVALMLAASLSAPPALATSYSTDQSDLYYIAAESGWGMQLVQRGSVIFATLFVYDPAGNPTWYVATMQSLGNYVWTGDLYATTGPWFGTIPFNPANVIATKVGTMTWTGQTVDTGNVSYTVNGVAVSKNVIRQTLVFDDYNGTYLGALHGAVTNCSNPGGDGTGTVAATITVVQSGQSVTITAEGAGVTLTAIGTLTQAGQFGTIQGTYSNTIGAAGTIELFEINGQLNYWTARFALTSTNVGCQETGYLGGMRE